MTLLAFPALAAELEAFTVDFTTKDAGWPSIQVYNNSYDSKVKFGGSKWTVHAMSNNQCGWAYMRGGAKSTSNGNFYIQNKSAIADALTKAELEISNYIRGKINSAKLIVADNSTFTNATEYSTDSDISTNGTWTFKITNPIANGYYKLIVNYTNSTKSHGVIDVTHLKFYKEGAIDYPTECADPIFNIANNAEVYPGQTITATCATLASTVSINGFDGDSESGKATYSIPEDAIIGSTITITAKAHVQGETKLIYSNEKTITLKVKEAPKATTLTLSLLKITDNGYAQYSYSDEYADYNIICNKYLSTSNFGWNLGNSNAGKNSGIIIAAKKGYKIVSITFGNPSANVKIFTNDKAYTALSDLATATALTELQTTKPTYSFLTDVFYCGARPTTNKSSMNFSSITVEFEALSAPEPPQEVHVTWTGLEGNAGLKTEPIALKVESEFPLAATIEPEGAAALVDLVASSDAISVVKNSNGNGLLPALLLLLSRFMWRLHFLPTVSNISSALMKQLWKHTDFISQSLPKILFPLLRSLSPSARRRVTTPKVPLMLH